MHNDVKNVLLLAMPYAGTVIPSIQLPLLECYLKERDIENMFFQNIGKKIRINSENTFEICQRILILIHMFI